MKRQAIEIRHTDPLLSDTDGAGGTKFLPPDEPAGLVKDGPRDGWNDANGDHDYDDGGKGGSLGMDRV